jgi:hypothetical protein
MNLPQSTPLYENCTLIYDGDMLTIRDTEEKDLTHYLFNGISLMIYRRDSDDPTNSAFEPITRDEMSEELYRICKPLIEYSVLNAKVPE